MVYNYYYVGTQLARMTYGDNVLDFFYDINGVPIAMRHGYASSVNYVVYYYITNLQGDVIRLVDVNGNTAAYYEYDPYGNAINASGSHATVNPLRYRGYVYDTDTGLYYLLSRYYDSSIGRFLNRDDIYDEDAGLQGYNLFVYCGNNPVRRVDISGADSIDMADGDVDEDDPFVTDGGGGNGRLGVSIGGSRSGSCWNTFRLSLKDAAKGLNMACGERSYARTERHHFFSNKNKKYTPQYEEITRIYGLSLDDEWNTIQLENHRGRHTNKYHDYMLDALCGVFVN